MLSQASDRPTLWRTCRVLANHRRLKIIALLAREPGQTVSAVAEQLKLALPTASIYLRSLEARSFLQARRSGRYVKYRFAPGADDASSAFHAALRDELGDPSEDHIRVFRLLTAFTHPRRIELVRCLAAGPKSALQLGSAVHIPPRALLRHLNKLNSRGLITFELNRFRLVSTLSPLAAALVVLATK